MKLPLLALTLAAANATAQDPIGTWIDGQLDDLESLYRQFHRAPELSFHETQTAARLAEQLEQAGLQVTRGVGGTGVVAVLSNGDGPVGMFRTDMDALPIAEQTGLEFAAPHQGTSADGQPVGVMHACGHDLHMTNMVGAARWLATHQPQWRGTLVFVGQPAEERAGGAKAMLAAGLLERFPRPLWALAAHTAADLPADSIGMRSGFAMANVDSCDITMFGRGGHGASPHLAIDPILQAATLVVELQSIVAREVDPVEPSVVTVGAIHGGSKHNIIDDRCSLQLTLRSYSPKVRALLMAAVERKARAVADGARAPAPKVEFSEPTPALANDRQLTARLDAVFKQTLGADHVVEVPPTMGAEDFGRFGDAGVPICMFRIGTIARDRLQQLQQAGNLPPLHSARYWPDLRPALRTGLLATIAALRALLPPP
ncbi:MAG TPA: amidohydrolase [Planctomycetota bacterium]|nr:amidohydrolase [Planctomycetota bacterium]